MVLPDKPRNHFGFLEPRCAIAPTFDTLTNRSVEAGTRRTAHFVEGATPTRRRNRPGSYTTYLLYVHDGLSIHHASGVPMYPCIRALVWAKKR